MIVEQLSLVDFRNYAVADVSLAPGPNVFVGRNGQGKTNLAEAIAFFATLGSHRVSNDAPMVRDGADAAIIRARLAHGDRRVLLEVQLNRQGSNTARVNGAPVKPAELPRYAQVVLFAPEDLQIVRGDPAARRRFADQLLVQRHPRMAGVLADYERVLKQRNALLKTARLARGKAIETLDVWDGHLTDLGGQLLAARLGLIADLAPHVAAAYASVAGEDAAAAGLGYAATVPTAGDGSPLGPGAALPTAAELTDAMRARVAERRGDELDRGMTLVGPHRDDLVIHLGPAPAKGFASHGESWSLALALKLATFALLRADGEDPILILDDVFATLDAQRRAALAAVARSAEQTLITAAVLEDVPPELRGARVQVGGGTATVLEQATMDGDTVEAGAVGGGVVEGDVVEGAP